MQLVLKAEDYLSDRVIEVENIYSGFLEGYISKEQLDYFYEKGELPLS